MAKRRAAAGVAEDALGDVALNGFGLYIRSKQGKELPDSESTQQHRSGRRSGTGAAKENTDIVEDSEPAAAKPPSKRDSKAKQQPELEAANNGATTTADEPTVLPASHPVAPVRIRRACTARRPRAPAALEAALEATGHSRDGAQAAQPGQDVQQEAAESQQQQTENASATEAEQHQKRRKKERTLVDVHGLHGVPRQTHRHHQPAEELTEYERQRLERIRQNQERLRALGLDQAVREAAEELAQQQQGEARPGLTRAPGQAQRATGTRAKAKVPAPSRVSRRLAGHKADGLGKAGSSGSQAEEGSLSVVDDPNEAGHGREEECMALERYFEWKGIDVSGAIKTEGRFNGWVNPKVCEKYGIEGNAADAWGKNGGGKFSFKIDKKAVPATLKARGWSDARAFSSTLLQKNPNSYFYRHVAPHQQQAMGDWTEEERALFLDTARRFGVGDKWGLFASYVPQRVGYQCSAYYREVIIPAGLVLDPRYRMSRSGKAHFVG